MFQITAKGPREAIEAAGLALSDMDPSPALAVDTKEETRTTWRLDAYAQDTDTGYGCVGIIELVAPELSPTIAELEDMDWVAMSLEGLPAIEAGPFVVAGAHELARGFTGRKTVWIEAGPAFGTGHHGTTLGCLKALSRLGHLRSYGNVLDLGTGSGVLAIAAIKAGAPFAIGTDIDADSVRIARINAENNKVSNAFQVLHATGAVSARVRAHAPYGLIFANILARPLIGLSREIATLLKPGGVVILSGLLSHQEPLVRNAFAGRGLTLAHRERIDGWSTLTYKKPNAGPVIEKKGPLKKLLEEDFFMEPV